MAAVTVPCPQSLAGLGRHTSRGLRASVAQAGKPKSLTAMELTARKFASNPQPFSFSRVLLGEGLLFILFAAEIVTIHTNPKRKRGTDLRTSLKLRVSVSRNREQYNTHALPLSRKERGVAR